MLQPRLVVVVMLAALLFGACSPQEPETTQKDQLPAEQGPDDGEAAEDSEVTETVELIAGDIYFDDEPSELPTGTIRFAMENEGDLVHNLFLEELDDRAVIDDLQAGEAGEGDATLDAGEYTFYCSTPGHRESGMEFSVTVE